MDNDPPYFDQACDTLAYLHKPIDGYTEYCENGHVFCKAMMKDVKSYLTNVGFFAHDGTCKFCVVIARGLLSALHAFDPLEGLGCKCWCNTDCFYAIHQLTQNLYKLVSIYAAYFVQGSDGTERWLNHLSLLQKLPMNLIRRCDDFAPTCTSCMTGPMSIFSTQRSPTFTFSNVPSPISRSWSTTSNATVLNELFNSTNTSPAQSPAPEINPSSSGNNYSDDDSDSSDVKLVIDETPKSDPPIITICDSPQYVSVIATAPKSSPTHDYAPTSPPAYQILAEHPDMNPLVVLSDIAIKREEMEKHMQDICVSEDEGSIQGETEESLDTMPIRKRWELYQKQKMMSQAHRKYLEQSFKNRCIKAWQTRRAKKYSRQVASAKAKAMRSVKRYLAMLRQFGKPIGSCAQPYCMFCKDLSPTTLKESRNYYGDYWEKEMRSLMNTCWRKNR